MKIRIKGNSIRIRLSRSEVDSFGTGGYLEERTEFGNSVFTYALQNTPGGKELSATYADNKMTVLVPAAITQEWTTTDKVGYENNMPLADGKQLFLLIEKDFKCVDNTEEDQSDFFEHPTKIC